MKIKKSKFSTMISDLYGKNNYQKALKVGREYWWYWPNDSVIGKLYGSDWYKIRITYTRSHCMFYIFADYPDVPEQFCAFDSFLASSLILADLDPKMDLPEIMKDGIDKCQQLYCFDDTRTIIHNWDNSSECDIDESDLINKDPIHLFILLTKNLEK